MIKKWDAKTKKIVVVDEKAKKNGEVAPVQPEKQEEAAEKQQK